jgi:hypothetical protein
MIPSKEKIEEIIKELQKIMRIQDWCIAFDLLGNKEFAERYGEKEQAYNCINRLLDYSYITINKDITSDWYVSLVHELIHLVCDPLETAGTMAYNMAAKNNQRCVEDVMKVSIERSVERMAKIFCTVYPVTNFIKEGD